MSLLPPGLRLSAHVELFRRNEETGEQMLVHTSRPCVECGAPLEGLIVPMTQATGEEQVHAECRRTSVGF